jgi:hypothetical protein
MYSCIGLPISSFNLLVFAHESLCKTRRAAKRNVTHEARSGLRSLRKGFELPHFQNGSKQPFFPFGLQVEAN